MLTNETMMPSANVFIARFLFNPPFIAKTVAMVIGGIAISKNVTFAQIAEKSMK